MQRAWLCGVLIACGDSTPTADATGTEGATTSLPTATSPSGTSSTGGPGTGTGSGTSTTTEAESTSTGIVVATGSSGSPTSTSSGSGADSSSGTGNGCAAVDPDYELTPALDDQATFATAVLGPDLDGDLDADVLMLTSFPTQMVVWLGDGTGSVTHDDTYALVPATDEGAHDVAVGVIDGADGVDAVVAFENPNSILVLSNDGGGAFGFPIQNATVGTPTKVAILNIDGDEDDDVLYIDETGVGVMRNDGAGNLTVNETLEDGEFGAPLDLTVADMNDDTNDDIVVAYDQLVAIWLGDGLGSFSAGYSSSVDVSPLDPTDIEVGDVTGDGVLDVVFLATNAAEVHILEGDGAGEFALDALPTDVSVPSHLELGNADSGCATDVFVMVAPMMFDEVAVHTADGAGGLNAPESFLQHSGAVSMDAADFNGDSLDDIVYAIGPTGELGIALSQ